jgi:hypothetical protein
MLKTKTSILLTSVLLATLACSSDKGSSSQSSLPTKPAADVSEVPEFKSNKLMPAIGDEGYTQYREARFGKSCQVFRNDKGEIESYRDKPGFDPSLKEGEETFTITKVSSQIEDRSSEERYKVVALTANKADVKNTYYSMIFSKGGGETLVKPYSEDITCMALGEHVECDLPAKNPSELGEFLTQQGMDYLQNRESAEMDLCQIQNAGSLESKVELGQFKLHDGRVVEAYMNTEIVKGKVICGDADMGEGEVKSYTVSSLQVKAIPGVTNLNGENQTCGGVQLVNSHVVKVEGKVLSSYRFEQQSPALK